MESTDLRNKARILIWLQASSSLSLDLSFPLSTMGGWSLRAFPAQTARALRASCPIALVSLLRGAFLEGAPPWASASLWKTSPASPGRGPLLGAVENARGANVRKAFSAC